MERLEHRADFKRLYPDVSGDFRRRRHAEAIQGSDDIVPGLFRAGGVNVLLAQPETLIGEAAQFGRIAIGVEPHASLNLCMMRANVFLPFLAQDVGVPKVERVTHLPPPDGFPEG